jgi:hypothetical protein
VPLASNGAIKLRHKVLGAGAGAAGVSHGNVQRTWRGAARTLAVPLRLRERRRIGHDRRHRLSSSGRGVSGHFWIPLTKREREEHEHDAAAVVPIVRAVLVTLLQLRRKEGRAVRWAIVARLTQGGLRAMAAVARHRWCGVVTRDADVRRAGSVAGGASLSPAA